MRTEKTLAGCVTAPIRRKPLARALAWMLLGYCGLCFSAQTAEATETYLLDIPVLPVEQALAQLAAATGRQLLFSYRLVDSLNSSGVSGEHTVDSALDVLLEGTGLSGSLTERGVILITATGAQNNIQQESEDMKMKNRLSAGILAALASFFGSGGNLQAQNNAVGLNENQTRLEKLSALEEIVVTGVTRSGVTKLESSIAITTADRDMLDREQPIGVGDALDLVPGLFVENSAGEIGINVSPRGLQAGDQQRFTSYQEDGLPINYTGEWNDQQIRLDLMTEGLDVIRGGTSGILTVNGAGALINFTSRRGGDVLQGDTRLTLSDYGTYRTDFFVGGPLADNWKFALGGFYRISDGERDAGFTANRGGQFRANLTREFDNGTVNLGYKKIDDNVIFYLPVPLQNQSNPSAIPGFDPLQDTLVSADAQNIVFKRPNGDLNLDLSDGAQNWVEAVTLDMQFDLSGGWSISNKARFTQTDIVFLGNYNGGNGGLVLAADRIDPAKQEDVKNLVDTYGGTPQLRYTSSGVPITDLGGLNGNGLTGLAFWGFAHRKFDELANDIRFTYETDRSSLSFGTIYFNTQYDFLESGASFLQEIKGQPRRLDIVTVDDDGEVLGALTDNSFLNYGAWYDHGIIESSSISHYVNGSFDVTENLTLDAGFRRETLDLDLSVEQTLSDQDLNASDANENNNVLADNTLGSSASGFYAPASGSLDDLSWTLGFNYRLDSNLALYGRYAESFDMPRLQQPIGALSGNPGDASQQQVDDAIGQTTSLELMELGVRYIGSDIALSATLFQTVFNDLTIMVRESNNPFSTTIQTETTGVEFELFWNPLDHFSLELSGVSQDAQVKGIPANADEAVFNGNQIQRTPELNFRITPTWYFSVLDQVKGDLYGIVQHTGDRYADLANDVELPAYTTLDMGLRLHFGDMTVQFKGNNLTDEIALTEGNPRSGLDQTAAQYYFARPKFGRNFTASVNYSF